MDGIGKLIDVAGKEGVKLTACPDGADKHADDKTDGGPNGDSKDPRTCELQQLIHSITGDGN